MEKGSWLGDNKTLTRICLAKRKMEKISLCSSMPPPKGGGKSLARIIMKKVGIWGQEVSSMVQKLLLLSNVN